MTTTEKQLISILFVPDTYDIIRIFDQTSGKVFTPDKLQVIGNNMYNWAKSIKPAPEQFGDLSSFLMAIKRSTPNGIPYKFTNNGNFLTEYLLGSHYSSNKLSRVFEITYSMTGNYHSLLVAFNVRSEMPIYSYSYSNSSSNPSDKTQEKVSYATTNTNTLQLRHELINPLNAIKLSGDQIRKHIRKQNGSSSVSIQDIDKFNNIILNEVDNSLYIIDTLINENLAMRTNISLDKIPLTTFNSYIQRQLDLINQTYFMFAPVHVDWPNEIQDTNYILTHYVCVNTNYMKIILDNVFRNIYGHIDTVSTAYTTSISSISNGITFNKENTTNKFTILISGNEIQLLISNKIKQSVAAKSNNNHTIRNSDWRNSKVTQSIIDRYNLVVDYQDGQCKSDMIIAKPVDTCTKSKNNMGIGLTLINNLCNKMDVKWNMIDNDTEICFILTIPVLSDTRHLGHFYQPVIENISTMVQCVL
jgi:hypothetical protein